MIEKLARYTDIRCCLIVGGLSTKVGCAFIFNVFFPWLLDFWNLNVWCGLLVLVLDWMRGSYLLPMSNFMHHPLISHADFILVFVMFK